MFITYLLFAITIIGTGLFTAVSIIRGGHAESHGTSAVLHVPEDSVY